MIFDQASSHSVAKYLEEPDLTMQRLNQYGFKNIDFKYNRVIYYMPDIEQETSHSLSQIGLPTELLSVKLGDESRLATRVYLFSLLKPS